jgi:hypothetical protein
VIFFLVEIVLYPNSQEISPIKTTHPCLQGCVENHSLKSPSYLPSCNSEANKMTVGIEEENPLVRTTAEGGFGIEVMNLDTCCIGMEKGIVADDMRHQCQFQQTSLLDFSYLETTNISRATNRKVNGLNEFGCIGTTSLNGTSPRQTVETSTLDGGFSLRNFKGIPLDPCLNNGQAVAAINEEFNPIIRSGVCSDQGIRRAMEDDHICIDDLSSHLGGLVLPGTGPKSCYGVSLIIISS